MKALRDPQFGKPYASYRHNFPRGRDKTRSPVFHVVSRDANCNLFGRHVRKSRSTRQSYFQTFRVSEFSSANVCFRIFFFYYYFINVRRATCSNEWPIHNTENWIRRCLHFFFHTKRCQTRNFFLFTRRTYGYCFWFFRKSSSNERIIFYEINGTGSRPTLVGGTRFCAPTIPPSLMTREECSVVEYHSRRLLRKFSTSWPRFLYCFLF